METPTSAPTKPGTGYVFAQFVLLGLAAALPFTGLGWRWGVPWSGWELVAGPVVGLGGAVLAAAAVRTLGRHLSALPQPLATAELVVTGPYRWLRHPIYSALVLLTAAWALVAKDAGVAVVTAALLVVLTLKSRFEERWLLARYADYAAYRQRTGGLWPRWR